MTLSIEIPGTTVEQFQKAFGPDLSAAAREALLINGYRTGRISLGFIADVLGLSTRLEAQSWLTERRVPLNYDLAELEADREMLRMHFHVEP